MSDTHVRASAVTQHASDVVLAESSSATEVRHTSVPPVVSDVVLAESMSDVQLAESMSPTEMRIAAAGTGEAPSFRAPAPPALPPAPGLDARTLAHQPQNNAAARDRAPMALLPGAKVDDFEIVRLLGRGAFGHVYLARQLSLDRLVALKISANRGSEGRTMARLEHQHIVQVFSETVDTDFNQRLLCMQLVPGIGLDKLIALLQEKHREQRAKSEERDLSVLDPRSSILAPHSPAPICNWTGAEMLEIVDRSGALPTALDPSALHDREALSKMDAIEATAWFGARLAEALDFAHRNGVLHRDIKPANILVNPYGRPMLADFNISSQPVGNETSGEEMFGGTFAYMAPEHLDAFNPGDPTEHDAVTARSDIYSLGLVLQQLLEARVSIPVINRKGKMADTLRAMADDRRRPSPACTATMPGARMTLERTIRRCLEPIPDDRFASGADLAAQLDGCQRMREAEKKLPSAPKIATHKRLWPLAWLTLFSKLPHKMFEAILRRPFRWLVILVVLPQLAGSAVNITYNLSQIVGHLSDDQKAQFKQLVNIYNAIVYPIAVVVFVIVVRRVWRTWRALETGERLPEGEVQIARRKALRLPRWIAALTAFGWFPGGIIFPLVIMWRTPFLDFEYAVHFLTSFCLSGLIAMAYSLCGVEFVVLRVLYPGLWRDAQNFTETARHELRNTHKQLGRIQTVAILIPLAAAIVFVMLADISDASRGISFRGMVGALIVLGILGFHSTGAVFNSLSRVLVALTNAKEWA
ncbi:MAG: serine/threonine-protein kinase [Pirellulales bacterium]